MDVHEALKVVDRERYVAGVKQASSPEVVARLLERLAVRPGDRVLEIGTGTGYSTALLKAMVGPDGTVATIDVNAGLVRRAQGLWAADGIEITAVTGDARQRLPAVVAVQRYDRVVAWVTVEHLPRSWVAMAVPGARMVVPVQLAPLAGASAVAAMMRTRAGLTGIGLGADTFAPAHPAPTPDAFGIPAHVDARTDDGSIWVSAVWFRKSLRAARAVLVRLAHGRLRPTRPVLRPGEDVTALASWLYTQPTPRGLTTAQLSGTRLIGASCPGDLLLLPLTKDRAQQGIVTAAGSGGTAARQAVRWVSAWRNRGRPGLSQLIPSATWTPDGWTIRAHDPHVSRNEPSDRNTHGIGYLPHRA